MENYFEQIFLFFFLGVGHGTFVAGIIASTKKKCSGIASESNLHIYKVFTNQQTSRTSWFLDAFNKAIQNNVHIINLSIGGPDFTDEPFIEKVQEVSKNGIHIISAIGNDGPIFGTVNNPADQNFVIGIGGINIENKISKFSSKGMTTQELPQGYGRIKPDLITYGTQVYGASLYGNCQMLSGTSVATPVITGSLALLLSTIKDEKLKRNVGFIKQSLMNGATRLNGNYNIFEQGSGKFDISKSFYYFQKNQKNIT